MMEEREGPEVLVLVRVTCDECKFKKHVGGDPLPSSRRSIHQCELTGAEDDNLLGRDRLSRCPLLYEFKLKALEDAIECHREENMKKALG